MGPRCWWPTCHQHNDCNATEISKYIFVPRLYLHQDSRGFWKRGSLVLKKWHKLQTHGTVAWSGGRLSQQLLSVSGLSGRLMAGGTTPHDHPTPAARCLKFLVPVGPYIRLECNPILNVKHIQEHQGTPSIVWKYRAVKCGFFNTAAS